tara:strand:+ start:10612 stop:11367 length:756 start_codon:yes stop_codon:yes gene_type:complete
MNQTVLITGGTGKFGRKFVSHFLEKNWRVVCITTSSARGQDLADSLGSPTGLDVITLNLLDPDAASKLLDQLSKRECSLNHLVNNARSLESLKTDEFGRTARKEFMDEYLMDVVVPYELSMAIFNAQPNQLKTITNIGSQYGVVAANPNLYDGNPTKSPIQYGVAKAALQHLTKELAVRMAGQGVRVNCIAYGGVEGRVSDLFKARYAALTPMGRMLSEDEVIGPLDFLMSEKSTSVTGHTLIADGGWSIW